MTNIIKLKKYLAKDIDENIIWGIKYNDIDPRQYFNGIKPNDIEVNRISEVWKKLKDFHSSNAFPFSLDIEISEEENKLQQEYDAYKKKYFDYEIFIDLIFHLETFEIKELSFSK